MTADGALSGAWVQAHPVLAVFAVALVARVGAAVLIAAVSGGTLFSDDVVYSQMAAEAAAGETASWSAYQHALFRYSAAFLIPVTAVYEVVGPFPLAAQLVVAVAGATAAGLAARLAWEVVDAWWALAAGLVVALLPSQILWSSLILKDALVWAALAGVGLTVAVAGRSHGRHLLAAGAAAAGLLLALGFLRPHSLLVAAWAAALASFAGQRLQRPQRVGGAVLLAVVIPWVVGLGPAGYRLSGYLADLDALAARREANATGATAIQAGGPVEQLVRGVGLVLLEPYPWSASDNPRLLPARAENVMWYPLLGLAAAGVWAGRRSLRVLLFPVLAGAALVGGYALVEGNLGTAYRHRGELVWAVAVLAVVGGRQHVCWRRQRREVSA